LPDLTRTPSSSNMQTTNQATIINDNDSLPDIDMGVASTHNSKEPSILYSFLPGSFEVILFVDYCEQTKK
jgi:hypothetical protein